MPTVTYNDSSYTCTTALKGADYIHLLDGSGKMIAAFDGITDFTGFTITDGSWTTPTALKDSYMAVVRDDGVIVKGAYNSNQTMTRAGYFDGSGDVNTATELNKWYEVCLATGVANLPPGSGHNGMLFVIGRDAGIFEQTYTCGELQRTWKRRYCSWTSPVWSDWYEELTTYNTNQSQLRKITVSTAAPSGGSDGDIWIVYS